MAKKRIAWDFDDTVFRTLEAVLVFSNERYGEEFRREQFTTREFNKVWQITPAQWYERWCLFNQTTAASNLQPMDGIQELLGILGQWYDFDIVTYRDEGLAQQTELILERWLPGVFSNVHYCSRGGKRYRLKSDVCLQIGAAVLFEDQPDTVQACAKAGIRVVVPTQPWNKGERFKSPLVTRLDSYQGEIVSVICEDVD
ncbi:hypothetical protein KW786_02840 [Candidatus Parcubacteria bacterium]|nr:hypothetical protein [Candidatus Parcubacteria bacterium]